MIHNINYWFECFSMTKYQLLKHSLFYTSKKQFNFKIVIKNFLILWFEFHLVPENVDLVPEKIKVPTTEWKPWFYDQNKNKIFLKSEEVSAKFSLKFWIFKDWKLKWPQKLPQWKSTRTSQSPRNRFLTYSYMLLNRLKKCNFVPDDF